MSRPRRRHRRLAHNHDGQASSVASRVPIPRLSTADARVVGEAIGLGRVAIGAVFLSAPVTALRIVGVDSATATRVNWLSRMTATRDLVLGAGTLQAARAGGGAGWLLAGAVSDAVDSVALAQAVRQRRAGGLGAAGMIVAGAGTSALGLWAAWHTRRSGRG